MEVRPRVLVVDDDGAVRLAVATALRDLGYDVLAAHDHVAALADDIRPHLAVLDVGLPGGVDGFELAERLRHSSAVPVLFLTAADRLEDRLRGFELGADDYIVKPFAMAELLARVQAVLRRTGCLPTAVHRIGDVVIDERDRVVTRSRVPVDLTTTEFDLLVALARKPGQVLSKTRLMSQVWGFSGYDPNLVEVHISSLRRKLETSGGRLIHTERGKGYRLGVGRSGVPGPDAAGSVSTNSPST